MSEPYSEAKKTIAIIPARGGSKRIPRKNVKAFFGRPMIHYSIEAALESKLFDRVLVSTDDPEIAEISKAAGAEVPMFRPLHLSDDHTTMIQVYLHALTEMLPFGERYSRAGLLLATAPFMSARSLRESYSSWIQSDASSMCAITSFPFPIFRAFKKSDSGHLSWFWPEHEMTRSNDLPEAFHDAGQFYWVKHESFLKAKRLIQPDTQAYELPRYLVQDIDTLEDWERAEVLYQCLRQQGKI